MLPLKSSHCIESDLCFENNLDFQSILYILKLNIPDICGIFNPPQKHPFMFYIIKTKNLAMTHSSCKTMLKLNSYFRLIKTQF